MPVRILFVDDDEFLLSALRRLVWDYEGEWECEFASNGPAALEILAGAPFDAIVSDMRMPGMDGAQLLMEVRDRHPDLVRIILSGQSDCEVVFRAIGPAHLYLCKPCAAEELKDAITRASALRDRMAGSDVHRIVSQVSTLPALPRLTQRVVFMLQSPDASIDGIAKVISEDVAMTAKVLHLANSSFMGLRQQVSDVKQAAAYLGINALKPLVFSAGIFAHVDCDKLGGLSLERLMQHSVAVAGLARKIAASESEDAELADHALLAGMLHDIGILVFAQHYPDQFQEILALSAGNSISLREAETVVMGTNHAEVGAHLLKLWGLPHPIAEAVAYHHEPRACVVKEFSPLTAVYAANLIEGEHDSLDVAIGEEPCDTEFLQSIGVAERFDYWKTLKQNSSAVVTT